jgi:hypothetical protein
MGILPGYFLKVETRSIIESDCRVSHYKQEDAHDGLSGARVMAADGICDTGHYTIVVFLLGYTHYMGGFILTILIRFILYTSYIASIVSSPQPSPCPS